MDEGRRVDRTWLCSVLFLDIVKYSSQSVETQIDWKTFFNGCLSDVLRAVAPDDRVVLDTGDGAVICFLGDPETALTTGLSLRSSFVAREATDENSPKVRIGINLGPIRLLRDINGNLNAVGDGINVGQRVMAFAEGNQLLISRSYFDVISCLTEQYKTMFRYDGVRQDKHVREHAVYALVPPGKTGCVLEAAQQPLGGVHTRNTPPFTDVDLSSIEELLSDVLGPMTGRIVRRMAAHATSIAGLCEALADDSLPACEKERFLQDCRRKLGSQFQLDAHPTVSAPANADPALQPDFNQALLERLRSCLSEFVGPIAKVMVGRAAKKAQSRAELYTMLASQLSSEEERSAFVSRIAEIKRSFGN